jgi:hypothetical protein
MIYENMLFSAGGGLERIDKLISTDPNCANLILGIGQSGIRAMEQLKKKVFHDLFGDDGIDAPPRFDSIRFLGIDSDPHSAQGLDTDEFFCLADDTLAASLRNKPLLQQDPALNWLDLENTPIPMMVIGFYLASADVKTALKDRGAYLTIALRLLVMPCLVLGILYLLGVRGTALVSSVVASSAPAATATTMFAAKYDRDPFSSVNIVVLSTLLSIVSMPLIVGLAKYLM